MQSSPSVHDVPALGYTGGHGPTATLASFVRASLASSGPTSRAPVSARASTPASTVEASMLAPAPPFAEPPADEPPADEPPADEPPVPTAATTPTPPAPLGPAGPVVVEVSAENSVPPHAATATRAANAHLRLPRPTMTRLDVRQVEPSLEPPAYNVRAIPKSPTQATPLRPGSGAAVDRAWAWRS